MEVSYTVFDTNFDNDAIATLPFAINNATVQHHNNINPTPSA